MYLWMVSSLSFAAVISLASGCSFPQGVEIKFRNAEETVAMAPIVVTGTDLHHTTESYRNRNYTFQVNCVFKSDGKDIPETIFLLHIGEVDTCDGSKMSVGSSYLAALKPAPQVELDRAGITSGEAHLYFMEYKPNVYDNGLFALAEVDLEDISKLCGLDSITKSYHGKACPTRDVTMDTCTTASNGPLMVLSKSLLVLMIFVMKNIF